jgi:cytochrome d ubiquinol oxidase subunit I
MVGAGIAMLVAIAYALLLVMGDQLEDQPRFLRVFIWLIPLPYIANTAGWLLTEVGRFPWIVYTLMKIADGVSITVPAWSVGLTLVGYTLIYAALMVADIYLLVKFARRGAKPEETVEEPDGEPAIALVGD